MVFYVTRGNYAVTSTEITDALGYTDIMRLGQNQTITGVHIYTRINILQGYATGFKPTGTTDTGILFTVPTAGGKTELRCSFQTGVSQILATEP